MPGTRYPILLGDSGISLQPASDADLDALVELYRSCEDFLALGPTGKASEELVLQDLLAADATGADFLKVVAADGRVLGCVEVAWQGFDHRPQDAAVLLLMVAGDVRNQGIGTAVVHAIERLIGEDPAVRRIVVHVQVNNPAGLRFWQTAGYQVCGHPELQEDGTTTLLLEKIIKWRKS